MSLRFLAILCLSLTLSAVRTYALQLGEAEAQKVLDTAIELSLRQRPPTLVYELLRVVKDLAPEEMDSLIPALYEAARDVAATTRDANEYRSATLQARVLMGYLWDLDPGWIPALFEQWPRPAPELGEKAARVYRESEQGVLQRSLNRMVYDDPVRALELLRSTPDLRPQFLVWEGLVREMARLQRQEELGVVVDLAIDQLRSTPELDLRRNPVLLFLRTLRNLAPEEFPAAYRAYMEKVKETEDPEQTRYLLETRAGTVRLTRLQCASFRLMIAYLSPLRDLETLREVADILEAAPGLEARVARVGGWGAVIQRYTLRVDGPSGPMTVACGRGTRNEFNLLRRAYEKDPAEARRLLEQSIDKHDRLYDFLMEAVRGRPKHPELAEFAFRTAKELILEHPRPYERADLVEAWIRAYMFAEGQLPREEVDFWLSKLDLFEPPEGSRHNRRLHLEATLVGEWAAADFEGAFSYAQQMENESARLGAFLGIAAVYRDLKWGRRPALQ